MRKILAEFQQRSDGRLILFNLTVYQEVDNGYGHSFWMLERYDVDFSRKWGYIFHMSGCGGNFPLQVSGIYFTSGHPEVTEKPCELCAEDYKSEAEFGPKTVLVRERNRTRRLRKLPKGFDLQEGEDLLGWLQNNAIQDDAVYCSTCKDWTPGGEPCEHVWWCYKTGWYSTPDQRCSCKSREECREDDPDA